LKRWEKYTEENTPKYHDDIWRDDVKGKISHYDAGRPAELAKHVAAGMRVCDLGAGLWGSAQWLIEETDFDIQVYAVDFSRYAMDWLFDRNSKDSRLHVQYDLADQTTFPEGFFDVVMAGELLEHYEEPDRLVREMARICRPKGWMTISTVDMHSNAAIRNEVVYPCHVWEFEPDDLIGLFHPYGEVAYWYFGNYHMLDCWKR